MYLAHFDVSGRSWLQAAVSLREPEEEDDDIWWDTRARVARAVSLVPDGAAALRVTMNDEGLAHTLLVLAPSEREPELRRCVASFTRLNLIVEDSAIVPTTRAAHDQLVDGFPPLQGQLVMPPYTAGSFWFACDFRVRPLLHELISEAHALGYRLGYQANVQPFIVGPEGRRAAKKNALHVRGLAGVPPALADLQQRLADGLEHAVAVVEEYLGVHTPEAMGWLRETLARRFLLSCGALRFDPPDFEFAANSCEESLLAGLHRRAWSELALDEICGSALDEEACTATLAWRPPRSLARLAVPAPSRPSAPRDRERAGRPRQSPDDLENAGQLPKPYEGNEQYIFVSYKREDLPRIGPILRRLGARGHHIWYDKGIPGGVEWDALIEERIERCDLLLLFVSQAAIDSRYVRREVKFADMLDKSILSVRLQPAELAHGMKMFMSQYQVIDCGATDFNEELERAIRYKRVR